MTQDFSCWDFGNKHYAITAWSEERIGYARRTQKFIQSAMPLGFVPQGSTDLFWFLIFRRRIQILFESDKLEENSDWLIEMIRFAYIKNYKIPDEFNYVPEIIYNFEKQMNSFNG